MLTTKLTDRQKDITKKKFELFDPDNERHLGYLKSDPSLFAYYMFKNEKGEPFQVFDYQDAILNDDSKRILVCIARQEGKSTVAAIKALHAAFFNNNYTVIVVSRTKDQSIELIRKIKVLIRSCTKIKWSLIQPKTQEAKTEINIRNMNTKGQTATFSRIISVPATDAARGYPAHMVICDESAFWENADYIFNQVVEPMTTFTDGKIMMLSTPNGKQGVFWNCYNSPYWEKYQFGWDVCPINTHEKMAEKRARMTQMQFASEYEAKFVASLNAYFHPKDVENAVDHELMMGHLAGETHFVVGVDFGKINDNAVMFMGKIENPTEMPERWIIKVIDRRVKPLGTNYAEIIGELKAIHDMFHPSLFVVDATGVGEAPADIMKEMGLNVEPVKFSLQSKMDLFSNMKVLFEQKRIKIPNELELINQLELFEYEYTSSGNIKLHAPDGAHDDEPCALALMSWGLTRFSQGIVSASFVTYGKEKGQEIECRHNNLKAVDGELQCLACEEMV